MTIFESLPNNRSGLGKINPDTKIDPQDALAELRQIGERIEQGGQAPEDLVDRMQKLQDFLEKNTDRSS